MRRHMPHLVVFTFAGLSACTTNHYLVTMTPTPTGVRRTLTGWNERTKDDKNVEVPLPKSTCERLSRAYGVAKPVEIGSRRQFESTFAQMLPDDFGGAGWCSRVSTPLGTSYEYREPIGGSLDLDTVIETRRRCADRFTDLLIAWMRRKIADDATYEKVRRGFDTTLRADVRNIFHLVAQSNGERQILDARAGNEDIALYLVQHGLADPVDVSTDMLGTNRRVPTLARALRRAVLRSLGEPQAPVPAAPFEFLDESRVEDAWSAFEQESQEVKATWVELSKGLSVDFDRDDKFTTVGVLRALLLRGVWGTRRWDAIVQVRLFFETLVEPYETDGRWIANRVRWDDVVRGDAQMPTIHFARWAVPAVDYQTAHFGRVVLEGRALAAYTRWREGLGVAQRSGWDLSIDTLTPTSDFKAVIPTLGFPEPSGGKLSEEGRKILSDALGSMEKPAAPTETAK